MVQSSLEFIDYYIDLDNKYENKELLIDKHRERVKTKIRNLGETKDKSYKYWIYLRNNPDLKTSPFLNRIDRVGKSMIRFRLGAHNLRIETGRWSGLKREDRLCNFCQKMDDEYHAIFECREIYRGDINGMPEQLEDLWEFEGVNILFKRLLDSKRIS